MIVYQIEFDEAKARFQDLIEAALRGETVFIVRDEQPVVQIVSIEQQGRRRKFGSAEGLIMIADDFDAPLADFEEYME